MSAHLDVLKSEFHKRIAKNERYSLRAYAKSLGVHYSALSRILAGKLEMTPETSVAVARKLRLDNNEMRRFVRSVFDAKTQKESVRLGEMIDSPELRPQPSRLPLVQYRKVAKLCCLVFLELVQTVGFKSEPAWIAKRMNLDEAKVDGMIEDLVEMKLIARTEDGGLVNGEANMTAVKSEETNAIHQEIQAEILESSLRSLKNDDFTKRLHYGMTMSINLEKIEHARKRIMAFIEQLSDELEVDPREEVYQLAVSLFPMTHTIPVLKS